MSGSRGGPDHPRLGWRIRLLLGCYPPWWRVRYDEEMRDTVLALREEGRWRASGARDLLRVLVEGWFAPDLVPSEATMTDPTRRLIPGTAWGLFIFVFSGAAFAKVVEDPAFSTATREHRTLSWCVGGLTVAAIATAVVMVLASLPPLFAVARCQGGSRWRDLTPLLVALASVGAFLLTLSITRSAISGTDPHQGGHLAAFASLVAVTILGGVSTTLGVMHVAMRVPDARGVAAARRMAMAAVGLFVAVAAVAVVTWTVVVAAQSPSLLRSDYGLLETPTLLTTAVVIAGLLVAAVLCGRSGVAALHQGGDGLPDRHT